MAGHIRRVTGTISKSLAIFSGEGSGCEGGTVVMDVLRDPRYWFLISW